MTINPIPSREAYRVKNSPAKIMLTEVKISLNEESLLSHIERNIVRFPDERSEWIFAIGEKNFKDIINRSNEDKAKLSRTISLKYSSLGGGKVYHYRLQQLFNPAES
jgi:hypothetical protein